MLDYDLMENAGKFISGKGKGKIGGSPGGVQDDANDGKWRYIDKEEGKQGQIEGSPIGIEGTVRHATSQGRMKAVKAKLAGY